MASIYANGSKGHHKFTLNVNETGTSVDNNTSTVSFSFVLSPIQTKWDWSVASSSVSYTVTINGTKYTGTIPQYDGNSTVTLKSGTQTVSHNADGTKSIEFSFSVVDSTSYNFTSGNASKSGSLTLTTIPRGATLLTASNFNDEQNPTITYSNPAGTAVTELVAGIFNSAGGVSYAQYRDIPKTGTSYTFNLTDAERDNLRRAAANSNSITITFYIRTKLGSNTHYHYLYRTLSITNANPIITPTVTDVNEKTVALTGDNRKLIKFHSNAKATMSVEAQKGAAINESLYIIRNGDNTGYGTSHTFENTENNVFTFSAEDSRGNIGTGTLTADMVDYVRLTCYAAQNRPDALGNMSVACDGNYFNGDFGAEENTLNVQFRCSESLGVMGDWTDMSIRTSSNSYHAYADYQIPDFDQTKKYDFEFRATDKLETVSCDLNSVKSVPIFHWGENDFVFEVPVTFNAGADGAIGEGNQHIKGNLRLKGEGNYGNYLYFGDGSYCFIAELEDDVMTLKASKINLVANGVYVDNYPIPILDKGIWTPTIVAASSYTTRYGWYMKMGQSVTVGFFIKATCKLGYELEPVGITGLPFTPMFSAAGGGLCSGVRVGGGWNFQCFVADANTTSITTRVQACNNTSQTNLSTSASGCFYPESGKEVTLGGTITFMANS